MKTTRKLIIILMMAILSASCSPETEVPEQMRSIWVEVDDGSLLNTLFIEEGLEGWTFKDAFKSYYNSDPRLMTPREKVEFEKIIRECTPDSKTFTIVNEIGKPFSLEVKIPTETPDLTNEMYLTYNEGIWTMKEKIGSTTDPFDIFNLKEDEKGNVWEYTDENSYDAWLIKDLPSGAIISYMSSPTIKYESFYQPDLSSIEKDTVLNRLYKIANGTEILSDGSFARKVDDYLLELPLKKTEWNVITINKLSEEKSGMEDFLKNYIPDTVIAKLAIDDSMKYDKESHTGITITIAEYQSDHLEYMFDIPYLNGQKATAEDFPGWTDENNTFQNAGGKISAECYNDEFVTIKISSLVFEGEAKTIMQKLESLVSSYTEEPKLN